MVLFFNGSKFKDQYRNDRPITGPLLTGVGSGLLSGLLGVGGGGLISPLMIHQGFNPKKVATVTAFAGPFSSFTAFLAYATMGSVGWKVPFFAGAAAWVGGYLGTIVRQNKYIIYQATSWVMATHWTRCMRLCRQQLFGVIMS